MTVDDVTPEQVEAQRLYALVACAIFDYARYKGVDPQEVVDGLLSLSSEARQRAEQLMKRN